MNKPIDVQFEARRDTLSDAPSTASLAMIDRLIAFPTVSRDSNLGLIEYARDELARLGVRANLIYDASRNKANLFATLSSEPDLIKTGGLVIWAIPIPCQSTDRIGRAIHFALTIATAAFTDAAVRT